MFDEIEKFEQEDLINALESRLAQNPNLAKHKLTLLPGAPTLEELLRRTKTGLCWGICARIIECLEDPMRSIQSAEACINAFSDGMKGVKSSPIETMLLQLSQHLVPRESAHINPPDMNSPFSMWYMGPGNSWLHTIITSNRHDLSDYFVFDPNMGLYKTNLRFTNELNAFKQQLSQNMPQPKVLLEVVKKSAQQFLDLVSPGYKERLALHKGIPYMGSKGLFDTIRGFRAEIKAYMADKIKHRG